jgi:hypothetical protein
VLQGAALLNDPKVDLIGLRSSAHTQVHMRTDMAPFTDNGCAGPALRPRKIAPLPRRRYRQ